MALGVPVASTDYSDIRHILPLPEQIASDRSASRVAKTILRVHAQHARIAAEQRRWVRENASIEKAAMELERVYLHYLRRDAVAQAA